MSIRYLFNLVLALVAGFLVVATQAFAPTAVVWLTFGIALGIVVLGAAMFASPTTIAQRSLSGVLAVVAAWTVVASMVFAPTTVVWLGFAAAIAIVALAVIGLTVHEFTTERVVHSLNIEHRSTPRDSIAA